MRNKVRAVSSLPIAFVQTHSGSLVALRFDSSLFLIGTEVPVVSSPRTVYDVHILIWVPLPKPHHPLDRYYTIAEPGCARTGSGQGQHQAVKRPRCNTSRFQLLGRGSNVSSSPREDYASGNRDFLVIISLNVRAVLAFSNSKRMTNPCVSPHHNHSVQESGINQLPY